MALKKLISLLVTISQITANRLGFKTTKRVGQEAGMNQLNLFLKSYIVADMQELRIMERNLESRNRSRKLMLSSYTPDSVFDKMGIPQIGEGEFSLGDSADDFSNAGMAMDSDHCDIIRYCIGRT